MLFDIDGTIMLTGGAGREALEVAFAELFPEIPSAQLVAAAAGVEYGGRTDPAILGDIAAALGWEARRFGAVEAELSRRYVRHLAAGLGRPGCGARLMPGIHLLLDRLRADAEVVLGLITGNSEAGARVKLAPFDLNRHFPTGGFGSDHIDRREVARVAHARAVDHHAIAFPPGRVVVIGDTVHDVDCARANGFRAVGVGTSGRADEVLAARPDRFFADLSDAGAVTRAIGELSET